MHSLQLITGNPRKAAEYEAFARAAGANVEIVPLAIDLPEPQEADPLRLLEAKVEAASRRTSLPFFVDDASFWSSRYEGFPGNFTKFVNRTAGVEGLRRLFDEGDAITAAARIALHVGSETRVFEGKIEGTFTFADDDPDASMPMNSLMRVAETGKTLGESLADPAFKNHRRRAFEAMIEHLRERQETAAAAVRECEKRWDGRATTWDAAVADRSSFVNHEEGYGRFLTTVRRYLPLLGNAMLDIGCGTGIVTRELCDSSGRSVIGIDISAKMIDIARRNVPEATFLRVPIGDLPDASRFSGIVSRGVVLSFLPRHAVADHLRAITRRAADGAYFIFDFVQNAASGGFTSSAPLTQFSLMEIARMMRELGWTLVDDDGSEESRLRIAVFHKPAAGTLFFATGNPRKVEELSAVAARSNRRIAPLNLRGAEIKSDSLEDIVADKLRRAHAMAQAPVICTDGGIFIDALGGFPGANSKQAAEQLGCGGVLKLLDGEQERRAVRRNCVGYFDGELMRFHTAEIVCDVAKETRTAYPSYEFDKILIPRSEENSDGRTYAEMPVSDRVRFTELPSLETFISTLLKENDK